MTSSHVACIKRPTRRARSNFVLGALAHLYSHLPMDLKDNSFLASNHPENAASRRPKPFSFKRLNASQQAAQVTTTTASSHLPIRSRAPNDSRLTQSFHLSENIGLQPHVQSSTQFFRPLSRSQEQACPFNEHAARLNLSAIPTVHYIPKPDDTNRSYASNNVHTSMSNTIPSSSPAAAQALKHESSPEPARHVQPSSESPREILG